MTLSRFNRAIILTAALVLICRPALSQEVIAEFSDRTLPVLNEELRKLRKSVQAFATLDTGTFCMSDGTNCPPSGGGTQTTSGTANEIDVASGSTNPVISISTTLDLGSKTSVEIPNSAAPTVDADGEIAVDTSVSNFSHGLTKYYSGQEVSVIGLPTAELNSPVTGDTVRYNATTQAFDLAPTSSLLIYKEVYDATNDTVAVSIDNTQSYFFIFNVKGSTTNTNIEMRFLVGNVHDFIWEGYASGSGAVTGSSGNVAGIDFPNTNNQLLFYGYITPSEPVANPSTSVVHGHMMLDQYTPTGGYLIINYFGYIKTTVSFIKFVEGGSNTFSGVFYLYKLQKDF